MLLDYDSFTAQVTIFLTGIIDSLSFHRTFPLLMKSKVLANTTFTIIAANSVLLLGSLILFHKAITPGLTYITGSVGADEQHKAISDIVGALFYALFVVPIYLLCYSTSMVGYQTLADEMYQSMKKDKSDTSIPRLKGLVDGTYATVAWLCLFVQLQLLNTVIPMLLRHLHSFLSVTIADVQVVAMATTSSALTPAPSATLTSKLVEIGLPYFKSFILLLVSQSITLTHVLGWVLMSVMYGWYAFDAHWITINVDPDTRFKILEKHWAYFLGKVHWHTHLSCPNVHHYVYTPPFPIIGISVTRVIYIYFIHSSDNSSDILEHSSPHSPPGFGFPYTLLVKHVSFFVGYGSYMALFPFCIMLGGISDYEKVGIHTSYQY